MDLGSFDVDPFDWETRSSGAEDIVYHTSVAGAPPRDRAITSSGVIVQPVLWTPGSARCLDAVLAMGALHAPPFGQITLFAGLLSTHPSTVRRLQAPVECLPRDHDVHWVVSSFGGNLLKLVTTAIEAGGHISIGLGDHPYRELGAPTNAELVAEVVRRVRAVRRKPAAPQDVREVLALGA